jgi:hypothetical protein
VYAIPNYDNWKLMNANDLQIVVGYCTACNECVYKGEEVYLVEEEYIHEDCFEEYAKQTLDTFLQYAD